MWPAMRLMRASKGYSTVNWLPQSIYRHSNPDAVTEWGVRKSLVKDCVVCLLYGFVWCVATKGSLHTVGFPQGSFISWINDSFLGIFNARLSDNRSLAGAFCTSSSNLCDKLNPLKKKGNDTEIARPKSDQWILVFQTSPLPAWSC